MNGAVARSGARAALLGIAFVAAVALSASAEEATLPYPGPADSIGSPANGCVAGAVEMPESGPGWEVLRPSTHRDWGNPYLIRFLEDMAAKARKLGTMLIGDIGLARGGPIVFGHASHQMGLDVDILFRLAEKPLSEEERDNPVFDAVVVKGGNLDAALWGAPQVTLLRQFAQDPRVERIFVNPAIKRNLCRTLKGDRAWLRKIRPWWGHEAHFHVRLVCPPGDKDCLPREALPEGDGCGATLAWWFTSEAARPKPPTGPKPALPAACRVILGRE